jgi:CHASE2 domain-containing sensor protein
VEVAVNILITLALLLSLASWAFLGLTFSNLLSGYFETRTCLTDCVKTYYFAAGGLGLAGTLLAGIAWFRSGFTGWLFLALLVTALPFAIVAGIFTIGTLGTMTH